MLLDRTETQSLPGETRGPVGETDVQVIISKTYNQLPWMGGWAAGECKERSNREASWRRVAVQLGLGREAGFPRSSEKTLKQSVRMQEVGNHIDLGSNPSSPLAS